MSKFHGCASHGSKGHCCALVTGATGALGPVVARHLVEAGYEVRAVGRCDPAPGLLPQPVEFSKGDICDLGFLAGAVRGARVVFHLAARLHVPNPVPALRPEYWRVNVEGTRCVVEACRSEGVQRLVYFSTINVYGATHGTCADEDTPPRAENLYAETKLAAEEIVLAAEASRAGGPLGVVLRIAAIYGPRMKGNYPKLVRALSRGWFVPVGDGRNRRTMVFEDDVARAAQAAAEHPHAPGRVFNVSDGMIHPLREIMHAICAAMGRTPPSLFVPARLSRALARSADGMAGLAGFSLNLASAVDKFVEDSAVSAERISRDLGFRPQYGLEEGWRRTIEAWEQG